MKLILVLILSSSCAALNHYQQQKAAKYEHFEGQKAKVGSFPVTDELTSPEYIAKFRSVACSGISQDACKERFMAMMYARLKEKYPLANKDGAKAYCEARPIECDDAKLIETWFILAHNNGVQDTKERTIAADEAADQRAWGELANTVERDNNARYNQPQPKIIQTGPIKTTCRPNGFGQTICETDR